MFGGGFLLLILFSWCLFCLCVVLVLCIVLFFFVFFLYFLLFDCSAFVAVLFVVFFWVQLAIDSVTSRLYSLHECFDGAP